MPMKDFRDHLSLFSLPPARVNRKIVGVVPGTFLFDIPVQSSRKIEGDDQPFDQECCGDFEIIEISATWSRDLFASVSTFDPYIRTPTSIPEPSTSSSP
jgi:hypothetical protein